MKRVIKFVISLTKKNNIVETNTFEEDFVNYYLYQLDLYRMRKELNKELAIIDMLVDNLFENDSEFALIKF